MSELRRAVRTPKPSGKVVANNASQSAPSKVSKRRGGGGARSQSARGDRRAGSSQFVAGARRAKALTDLIDGGSISPGSGSNEDEEDAALDGGGTALGVDEDEAPFSSLDHMPEPEVRAPFWYTAQWRIWHKKQRLEVTMRRWQSTPGSGPIDAAKQWFESEVAKLPGYGLKQISLSVGYPRLGAHSWFAGGVGDFAMLMDRLLEWDLNGKQGLVMNVEAYCVSATESIVQPSQSTQGRRSATNQQLAGTAAASEGLVASGNLTEQITERWICQVKNCKWYTNLCYWAIRDERLYHLPIYAQILTSWGASIRAGALTVEAPSHAMIQQMVVEKARLQAKEREGEGRGKKIESYHVSRQGLYHQPEHKGRVSRGSTRAFVESSEYASLSELVN
ncbi:hypothetical protein LTR95_014546 [Oleoguttula sp. CCFEE 5521]